MEARVATVDQLRVGTMRRVTAGETSCLLVRRADGFRAYPARCPHYDGPLDQGVLHEDRIVCPWHHAVYSAEDGDLLEPPSFAGLTGYPVRVEGDDVLVDIPEDAPRARTMPMAAPDAETEPRTAVIVGAGAAGAAAAEALREAGFAGRITMVSREDRTPYDRPNCSKDLLAGTMPAKWMPLRSATFYERHGIERLTGEVSSADVSTRTVILEDGRSLEADRLLLAPGGEPRRLPVPGSDLPGVFTLRTLDDCERIVAATEEARRAVIVGASFIGLEVAASLRHRELDVTVVAPEEVPFERQFGARIGAAVQALHERHGVRFRLSGGVSGMTGDGTVQAVELSDGDALPADLVVVGVGVRPATAPFEGVELQDDGALAVDDRLRVGEGVWAAGDVARYPSAHLSEQVRIEHWRLALQHGRSAGYDMAGQGAPFTGVPFFWSQQYDVSLGFSGYGGRWDEVIITGDVEALDFSAFFCAGATVRAAAGTRDAQLAAFEELMRVGKVPATDALRDEPDMDLRTLLR